MHIRSCPDCCQHHLASTVLRMLLHCTQPCTGSLSGSCGAAQAERKAQEARTAAAEHVQELGSRIEQRRRWLEDESAAVQKKVADAQAPVVAEQQERAQARDAVAAIVARLR